MPKKPATPASPLLDILERRRDEMIDIIRALVQHESPSHDKKAVDEAGESAARLFELLGGRVTYHKRVTAGDVVQIDFNGARKVPRVLLLGHHDTVYPRGALDRMPWRTQKGRLYGPGVFDMKAGIAMMMFAVSSLRELHGALPRPVTVLLSSDEEIGSHASRMTVEAVARQSAAVLVLEPSHGPTGACKTARSGVGEYRIEVSGVAAHAGLDFDKGHSAILELAAQLLRVAKFTDRKKGITVNPGVLQGGTRSNVIAESAHAIVDARVTKTVDAKTLDKRFQSLKAIDKKCKLEISGGINRPPLEKTAKNTALYATAKKLAAELGYKLDEASVGGGSDGNFTSALGVPTLDGLGAVGEGAHSPNESVLVAELGRRTALVARLIETI
jgi:glutamate carboxypeptidase